MKFTSLNKLYYHIAALVKGICSLLENTSTMVMLMKLTNFGHPNPPDVGILTDKAASPYVTVTNGTLTADETLRIQAVLDLHAGTLTFNLLDMTEGGRTGAAVQVTADGTYTLPGFAGSALSSLNVTVNNFAELVKMIRSGYSGRLVDVLVMKMES